MIQQTLTVTTDLFEVTTPGPDFINPRCFGEDFANWLIEGLKRHGIGCSEPIQEDWGWALEAHFQDRCFTIAIGVMDDSIGQIPAEWSVTVAYEKPLNKIRDWFRPAPTELLRDLARIVHGVLGSESRIKNLQSA